MSGLIFGSHGLVTWGPTSRACYQTTLRIINRAAEWLNAHGKAQPFGPEVAPPLPEAERRAFVTALAPRLRRLVSDSSAKVLHFADSPAILEFVGSARGDELAATRNDVSRSLPAHQGEAALRAVHARRRHGRHGRRTARRARGAVSRGLHRVLRPLQAGPSSPAMRDPNPVLFLDSGRRAARVSEGQADGASRRRVLRQHDQRGALGRGRRRVRADRRAGGVRHRVLAARGGQAAAAAEAEAPRRAGRARDRRRRRHRRRGCAPAPRRGRQRRHRRHR